MKDRKIEVYLDSDVIISSLRSKTGAANILVSNKILDWSISDIQVKELEIVAKRQGLKLPRYKSFKLKVELRFTDYVLDKNDAHILAGAASQKSKFLVTYNLRHYLKDKIKPDFDIVLLTPGQLLQYLRS